MEESLFQINSDQLFAIRESNDGKQKTVEVHLRQLPNAEQWLEVLDAVGDAMEAEIDVCQIRLERLEYCDSQGLGMWLSLDAKVRDLGGRCEFWVCRGTRLHKILDVTRLSKILDICLFDR